MFSVIVSGDENNVLNMCNTNLISVSTIRSWGSTGSGGTLQTHPTFNTHVFYTNMMYLYILFPLHKV